jgi:methylated-DNA-[protein]-cysteine S-methyltransferase
MKRCFLQTPLGICQLLGDEQGVSQLVLVEEATLSVSIPKELKAAVAQIQEYFAGNRTQFDLKLNPAGTEFQKKVWAELQHIPYGKTLSYLELSKKLGDPKAIRAVAASNGKNPLWIIIPCHRVIGSDGSLTGYAGGLWRKKWLLEHESPATQQRLFG